MEALFKLFIYKIKSAHLNYRVLHLICQCGKEA